MILTANMTKITKILFGMDLSTKSEDSIIPLEVKEMVSKIK